MQKGKRHLTEKKTTHPVETAHLVNEILRHRKSADVVS